MFQAPEEKKKEDQNMYLTNKECFVKMFIAMFSLGIMTFFYKVMQDHYRHTVFEDIYGRGLVFFLCASIHYMRNKKADNSVFDIK